MHYSLCIPSKEGYEMKITIFTLILIFSSEIFAKDRVLLVFNVKGITGATSNIIIKGIRAGLALYPELNDKIELENVFIDETIEDVTNKIKAQIKIQRPVAIIGALSSNQAFLINIISKEEKIVFVTPFATHPEITKQNPYAIRVCFDDIFQAEKLGEFIYRNQKLKNGLVAHNTRNSYSIGIKNTFVESFSKFKGSKISSLPFSSIEDFKTNFIKLAAKENIEFVVLPSYQTEASSLFLYLSENFKKIKVYGTDSWGGGRLFHSVLKENPNPVEGFYVQHWHPSEKDLLYKKFMKEILKDNFLRQNESVSMIAPAAVGFDSFVLFAEGYKKSLLRSNSNLLENIKNVKAVGLTGRIEMQNSQTPKKTLYIFKINNKGDEFYASFN